MGTLKSCGYALVYLKTGETRSLHMTWRGAVRAHRFASNAGHEVVLYEAWHTSAVKESP
jgi:hypothetical protein